MRFPWRNKTAVRQTSETPEINWFWTLTLDGTPAANFDWPDILRGLEGLRMDPDSFLILERRNPAHERESGFLQCAMILTGDHFDWPDILRGLEGLRMDPDSFLILERRNPAHERESGFLQCAMILTGDRAGWYTLECGYPGPEGPVLLTREVPSVLEVVPIFEAVYRRRGTVFTGFSDLSDAMGPGKRP